MAATLAEVNRMQQALQANQQAHAERLALQANRAGCVFNMVAVANTVATAAEEGTSADPEAKFVGALSVNAGTVKDNPFVSASPSWFSGDVDTQAAHATRVEAEFETTADEAAIKSNAIAEAAVANGEFKSSAVATQARVDEAKLDAEATAEALVADATEALSVKVGTASADYC